MEAIYQLQGSRKFSPVLPSSHRHCQKRKWLRMCQLITLGLILLGFYLLVLLNISATPSKEYDDIKWPSELHERPVRYFHRNLLTDPAEDSILDMPNFSYILNNVAMCDVKKLYFLTFVHSKPDHFRQRQVIRSTWGSVKCIDGWNFRTVFLIGKLPHESLYKEISQNLRDPDGYSKFSSTSQLETTPIGAKIKNTNYVDPLNGKLNVQGMVKAESDKYKDIIQGNFVDSYRNLTYKHVMGYKWVSQYCNNVTFALKSDDDIFIDVYQLFRFITRIYGYNPKNCLICNVFPEGTGAEREGKWKVSLKDYPYSAYPRYCGGLAYLITADLASDFYRVSQHIPFFWIDDVYTTGFLAEALQVNHFYLNLRYTYSDTDYYNWLEEGKERPMPYMIGHIDTHDPHWKDMVDRVWNKTVYVSKGNS